MKLNYFNFKKLNDQILLTNDMGNYIFVEEEDLKKIVAKKVDVNSELGQNLIRTKMIYDEADIEFSLKNRYNMRNIKGHLNTATSLHIFVVTTACNMGCVYCQANNGEQCSNHFMTKETAEKAVDIALQSPAYQLSFEFQGGEPLLNYDVIKHIVEYAEERKGNHEIAYNIVSNLTLLTDEMLNFFCENKFGVSTSIDGTEKLHNANRPYKTGASTYQDVVESIQKVRAKGISVGAIETTTQNSIKDPKAVVKGYVDLNFDSIFIRPLTPLGKATVNWDKIGYSAEEFIKFYIAALEEIIEINKSGYYLKEAHAAILLSRIMGQFVNYMELRSPCGAALGQLAYYPDGKIFTCDEGRMLYEMGDDIFCLGNVYDCSYKGIVTCGTCRAVCVSSMLETIPACCDCVYQPYCGTCPVVNYAKDKDVIEKKPNGYRCQIYSAILDYLFKKFQSNDMETIKLFNSWSN